MSLVAVVVPAPAGKTLSSDEEISLRHLEHFLGDYDRYFIAPPGVSFSRPGFRQVVFPRRYFGSARAHARLQLSEEFYERFAAYEYILMYHLDALVFSDRLAEWCGSGFDFVGAPWLPCADSPWVTRPQVGNGGFALMRVESFLKVMRSDVPAIDPDEYWREVRATVPWHLRWTRLPAKYLRRIGAFNSVKWEMRRWPVREYGNSDYFWAAKAARYWPGFRIASPEQALEFAFEVAPRLCYERNGGRLPFGCHAWPRYDRAFWEPFLLK